MIRYMIIRDMTDPSRGMMGAVCACEVQGDHLAILARADNMSVVTKEAERLVAVLNESDVAPIHLQDIFEDMMAEHT